MTAALERTVRIVNLRGLHARAAAKFVRMAEQFKSDVRVSKDGNEVCGTSIVGLLTLAASIHTEIMIRAAGDDADKALDALESLVSRRFDESD
jgi:phosphocarrier protein HPr